ncbi:hypothetical protein [Parapedobacter koreensis]|uniref:Right handed beta helix region n=1 Tax=Parapedobacter koreensis TaxID=332977 RepID=A0A1H7IGU9_9SPHI|nr:hypothetical protein [Parapedobacter koreensis]SEK61711.1 hypothetical protein SAMN05421740_102235 [Parapedobacter koreensis]
MTSILISILATLATCTGDGDIQQQSTGSDSINEHRSDSELAADKEEAGKFIVLGTGEGEHLVIDGAERHFSCDTLIKIKGGTYAMIDILNLEGREGCPIIIENEGLVDMTGGDKAMRMMDLSHVVVTGNGVPTIDKGFIFGKTRQAAVQLYGVLNDFKLSYFSFKDMLDGKAIICEHEEEYNGREGSYSNKVTFSHITCDRVGVLLNGDAGVDGGKVMGMIKNLEIAYVDYRNSPYVGSIVWMSNLEDYNVHHNTITDVNSSSKLHNGIFVLMGNGKFHNNMVTNHQGNVLRAWGYTVGSTPKDIQIYNNIVYNSFKYSAFEVQSFDYYIHPGKTTYANAQVFNNTCGKMNTSQDWVGAVVDVYSLQGGSCDVYNNLAFELVNAEDVWNQQADLIPTASHNLYFNTPQEAGIVDEKEFKLSADSKAKQAGRPAPVTEDFYGHKRAGTPSVGAVE